MIKIIKIQYFCNIGFDFEPECVYLGRILYCTSLYQVFEQVPTICCVVSVTI